MNRNIPFIVAAIIVLVAVIFVSRLAHGLDLFHQVRVDVGTFLLRA
jgi:hypothetical protein